MCRGGSYKLKLGVGLMALTVAFPAFSESALAASNTNANVQSGRTLSLTLPLVRDGQVFGDMLVRVDAAGAIGIESQSLRNELAPLLNDAGMQALDAAIAAEPFVAPRELAAAGIELRYDSARLELQLVAIAPSLRSLESIGAAPAAEEGQIAPIASAGFSAYLNVNASVDYDEDRGLGPPSLFLFGAARHRNVVLEVDGAFTDDLGDEYRFYRRGVRGVYDDRENHRRFSAGDLRLATLPLLRTQFIGGIAVEKSRRIFDPFSPVSRFGGQQIFLDSPSTVEVLVNGAPYRTLQLPAGAYDLGDLPLQYGANDIRLVVRDQAGREQVTSLDYYFDPIDLAPGEEEYVAGLGVLARELSFEPDYSNDPIFVGSYRRAFTSSLLLGGGLQLSKDVQVAAAEARFAPQVLPGAFDFQIAVSNSDAGIGFAGRAAWRWSDGDIEAARRFTIAVDYESDNYRVVGESPLFGARRLSVTASYSQAISTQTRLVMGATYLSGAAFQNQSNVFADVVHIFDERYRISAGLEYGRGDVVRNNFGVRLAFAVTFGPRDRADLIAQSRREFARASYSRSNTNAVGSLGYDVGVETVEGNTAVDAFLNYTGNRFDAQALFRTGGSSFGGFADRQSARLQIGTSLAFADGSFGIGRPIDDAFVLVRPHSSLEGRRIIAGRDLNAGRYEAASGTWGAAVVNNVTSYIQQNILYDVDNPPTGYDIGAGIARLDPPFRSGAVITVGSANFVSAFGTLQIDSRPAALVSGGISSPDDSGFEPQSFFTNSGGRFAIIGLAPGKTYVVRLHGREESFTINIPFDNHGLYRMETVNLQTLGN